MRLAQVASKIYTEVIDAQKKLTAKGVLNIFLRKETHNQLKLIHYSWMNRNKKKLYIYIYIYKVKFILELVTKAHRGTEVIVLFSLTSTLDGVGGHRHGPAALLPRKNLYPLYRRLSGPQGRSRRVRKIWPPPGFDPQTVQPLAQSLRLRYPALPPPHTHIYIYITNTRLSPCCLVVKCDLLSPSSWARMLYNEIRYAAYRQKRGATHARTHAHTHTHVHKVSAPYGNRYVQLQLG